MEPKAIKEVLVSVVVPVYNVAPFLERCVHSILTQTHKNLEIIIVDDGSSDGSEAQCDALAIKEPRIKVIHQKNAGLSAARNAGIAKSHGDYIVFIDSDDYVNTKYIEELLTAIIKNNADISLCGFTERDYHNNRQNEVVYSYLSTTQTGKDLLEHMGTRQWYSCVVVWNKMYRRELLNNIKFPPGQIHEDEYATPMILNTAKKVAIVPNCLYNYCRNTYSITGRSLTQKHIDDMLLACHHRVEFFKNKNANIYHKALKALLDVYPGLYYKSSDKKQKERLHDAFIHEYRKSSKILSLPKKAKLKFACFFYAPSLYVILKKINDRRKHEIF